MANGVWVTCPCGAEGWGDEIGATWDRDSGLYTMACCDRRDHGDPKNGGGLLIQLRDLPESDEKAAA